MSICALGYKKKYCKYVKRTLDVFFSFVALILLSWLFLILALLVKKNLGKPVIHCALRVGKNGKVFKLYKFRSMTNEKDENGKLLPDRERLTPFGKKLRESSLDELPELVNILRGDMSIIGPRPWAVADYEYFTEEENKRHYVKPGLSGLAQINGRTAASWDKRIKYDLDYVATVSFKLDVKILFLTCLNVLKHKDVIAAEEQGDFSEYRKKQWESGEIPRPEKK